MSDNLLTNEWIDATTHKPWAGRTVLCRTKAGTMFILKWNGLYWIDGNLNIRTDAVKNLVITHFYIFERYIDENN